MRRFLTWSAALCCALTTAAAQQRQACTVDQARTAEQRQDWDGAIRVYTCLSQASPQDWRPVNAIAGLYGIESRPQDQMQWAQRAVALAPAQPEPYINLGNAQAALHNTAGAQASFGKAMQVAPSSPIGAYSLGVLADESRNTQEAERWYRRALSIDPRFEDASVSLAALLGNTGRVQQAIPILQQVVAADPQAQDAKQMLAAMQGAPSGRQAPAPGQGAPIERR